MFYNADATVTSYADADAAEQYGQAFLGKEPSDLHHSLVAYIQDHSGIEIDPRQVQAVLALHGKWQKSEYNTNRANYRPRTISSIAKGGATTAVKYGAELFSDAPATTGTDEINAQSLEGLKDAAPVEAPKAKPARKPRKTAAQRKAEAAEAAEREAERRAEADAEQALFS